MKKTLKEIEEEVAAVRPEDEMDFLRAVCMSDDVCDYAWSVAFSDMLVRNRKKIMALRRRRGE